MATNVFDVARKSASRTTGITQQLEPAQAYAVYAYMLRTKCGVKEDGTADPTAPWAVQEPKNIGEFGAVGRKGRDLAAGNMHFYQSGSCVPSPNVSVPPLSALTDADWKMGRKIQALFAVNVADAAIGELPLDKPARKTQVKKSVEVEAES